MGASDVQSLRCDVQSAREESEALLDCLVSSGLLRRDAYLGALHRRRFAAMLSKHPLGEGPGLQEALDAGACAERLGVY